MKHRIFEVALGLALCTGAAFAQKPASPSPPPFMLITELAEKNPRDQRTILTREIALSNGSRVKLQHIDTGDGLLTLNSANQSQETLRELDKFCSAYGEMKVSRTSEIHISRETIVLPPCTDIGTVTTKNFSRDSSIATKPGKHTDNFVPAKYNQCGNVFVTAELSGPGLIPHGENGYFTMYADFEMDSGGGGMASVTASPLPSCFYSESSWIPGWGTFHYFLLCGTYNLSLGYHFGSMTASVCNESDTDTVSTFVF